MVTMEKKRRMLKLPKEQKNALVRIRQSSVELARREAERRESMYGGNHYIGDVIDEAVRLYIQQ